MPFEVPELDVPPFPEPLCQGVWAERAEQAAERRRGRPGGAGLTGGRHQGSGQPGGVRGAEPRVAHRVAVQGGGEVARDGEARPGVDRRGNLLRSEPEQARAARRCPGDAPAAVRVSARPKRRGAPEPARHLVGDEERREGVVAARRQRRLPHSVGGRRGPCCVFRLGISPQRLSAAAVTLSSRQPRRRLGHRLRPLPRRSHRLDLNPRRTYGRDH